MASGKKDEDIDYYELLGIELDAEQMSIRKAYRKKALECHPDKNPDNPEAVERFHLLSRALEILTNAKAKAAYDKVLKAKLASKVRLQFLDAKRLKLKDDLERREREAEENSLRRNGHIYTSSPEELIRIHRERLRREGAKLLEEQQKLMREKLLDILKHHAEATSTKSDFDSAKHRLKIKWNSSKNDPKNGGYSVGTILKYLKKYGDIVAFIMSKKPGSAMVEFKTFEACEMALKYEKGMIENPLNINWVVAPLSKPAPTPTTTSSSGYEDLVMRKRRQAAEGQRLIEQIKKEEAEEEAG